MAILSIQSHVVHGYVGNKAAVYPLQAMGYEVWPINTVQFSNHTGYGKWQGEVFSGEHIRQLLRGLEDLDVLHRCNAVLSGYLGSSQIGECIYDAVACLQSRSKNLIYLCDPVIGDVGRGIFVKPDVLDFFKTKLRANIITPNHFEAEILSNMSIHSIEDAKKAAAFFHEKGIEIVIITSLRTRNLDPNKLCIFLSQKHQEMLYETPFYPFDIAPNGTGDLFSALFLGHYLHFNNAKKSLGKTIQKMDEVMKKTFETKNRELCLNSVSYAK